MSHQKLLKLLIKEDSPSVANSVRNRLKILPIRTNEVLDPQSPPPQKKKKNRASPHIDDQIC